MNHFVFTTIETDFTMVPLSRTLHCVCRLLGARLPSRHDWLMDSGAMMNQQQRAIILTFNISVYCFSSFRLIIFFVVRSCDILLTT